MKVTISLNQPFHQYAPILGIIFWLLGLILVSISVIMIMDYVALRNEYPQLNNQLNSISNILMNSAEESNLPPEPELRKMRDRVQVLNSHALSQGVRTVRLLDWIEKNMPDNVYLVEFHHDTSDKEVVFVAEAQNYSDFTLFLNFMEKEPWFSDAILNKKEVADTISTAHVQYELRVRLK